MRRLLLSLAVYVAAGMSESSDAGAVHEFPQATYIDHRVHLSEKDRDQIVGIVATKTSQHISSVWWYGRPDKIYVMCGYNDLVHGRHPTKGDGFILRRTSSGWNITEQLNWSENAYPT